MDGARASQKGLRQAKGNQFWGHDVQMVQYRGDGDAVASFCICTSCGAWSERRCRYLAVPCAGRAAATRAGTAALRRVLEGWHPTTTGRVRLMGFTRMGGAFVRQAAGEHQADELPRARGPSLESNPAPLGDLMRGARGQPSGTSSGDFPLQPRPTGAERIAAVMQRVRARL